eukprot:7856618-Pyramimonas_sp.AAC.1
MPLVQSAGICPLPSCHWSDVSTVWVRRYGVIDVEDQAPDFAERVCKTFHAQLPIQLFNPQVCARGSARDTTHSDLVTGWLSVRFPWHPASAAVGWVWPGGHAAKRCSRLTNGVRGGGIYLRIGPMA